MSANTKGGQAAKNTLDKTHASKPTLAKRNSFPRGLRTWGMRFTVFNDGGNNGEYVLVYGLNSTDIGDNTNWQKKADIDATWGGGGGGSYTFQNGVTESGGIVGIGGTMVGNTTVNTDGYDFVMQTVKSGSPQNKIEFRVEATNLPNYTFVRIKSNEFLSESKSVATVYSTISQSLSTINFRSHSASRTTGFEILNTGIIVRDTGGFPLLYNQDNTANLSNANHIPHKGYVDARLGGNALDALIITPTIAQHNQAIRWNNTNLEFEFFTPAAGISGLTSGRVPFANSSTTITDEAGFEYSSTILQVPSLAVGNPSVTGDKFIITRSLATHANLSLQGKGNGYVEFLYNGARVTTALNIYTHFYTDGIVSFDSSDDTQEYSISIQGADSSQPNGRHFEVYAGAGYGVSGNGNGGSILLQVGQRRVAGSGVDGNITFDALTGSVLVAHSSTTLHIDGRTDIVTSASATPTLDESYRGKTYVLSNAAPVITLSGSFTTGFQVAIQYTGTPGAGLSFTGYTTLESVGGADTVVDQFGWVYLVHKGANVWAISGNLT